MIIIVRGNNGKCIGFSRFSKNFQIENQVFCVMKDIWKTKDVCIRK